MEMDADNLTYLVPDPLAHRDSLANIFIFIQLLSFSIENPNSNLAT